MNGQLNSLESFDSGSNYKFGDKMVHSSNPRSLFDLSHLNTLTIPNCGMLVPISLFETIPGDDHDISVDALLRVMPQVLPLYSRQRLYIYAFYSRYSDLWNKWQVFMDKGYTGTVNYTIPKLQDNGSTKQNITYSSGETIKPNDLFDYMGLPIGASLAALCDTSSTDAAAISALPLMMYLRIYRDYFMNKNHWINDRVMLPDDDSRFRLDNDGILLSAKDESKTFKFCTTTKNNGKFDLVVSGNDYTFSGAMHDYPDDYFISALPFTQRGNMAELKKSGYADFSDSITDKTSNNNLQTYVTIGADGKLGLFHNANTQVADHNVQMVNNPMTYVGGVLAQSYKSESIGQNIYDLKSLLNNNSLSLSITLEDIRKLAIEQQELEQLARTDGSYYQFGLSFFGEPSKAAYDFRPTYIGGTYKNIAFTEVLQTATTQTTQGGNTVDNPAGAYVGHGITGISNGRIGHIHCDDYGMIMILACIMPDVYYSQGLEKLWTDQLQSEKFMPERVLLGMQPIYNKEIYYAGNNGSSQGDDNYLWAYQNPFDNLRYIPNKIHGKIADPNNKSFYPFTQARHFTQLPNWGREFSSTADVRKDYLTAPSEDAYSAQFSINIRSVRPLPYKAIPAKLVHM